jgi:DNA-binding response OmpR family regulator
VNGRVLVADDDADIRRLVAFTLKRRGFEVLEASDGDAALALVLGELPDAAVLDVMMPGRTGLEVAQAMRSDARAAGIPVLLLSARGQASEVAEGLDSGARGYLVKPFDRQELVAALERLLRGREESGG